jgi:ferredoxin
VEAIEGSEFTVECDSVIVAAGQRQAAIPFAEGGELEGDPESDDPLRARPEGLYVCGDYLTGSTTVIEAVASGRLAAGRIAHDLTGRGLWEPVVRISEAEATDRDRTWDFIGLQEMPSPEMAERLGGQDVEAELGLSREAALEESKRCYLCYLHYEIDIDRCIYCRYCIDAAPRDCIKLVSGLETNEAGAVTGYRETTDWSQTAAVVIDNSRCIRCGACLRICPVDCISVSRVERIQRPAAGEGN